ncbi:MAG: hypothetical protein RIR26_522 [Pseudomonadota bacterium]
MQNGVKMMMAALMLTCVGCKAPQRDNSGSAQSANSITSNQQQLKYGSEPSQSDLEEFYEIVKSFYLKKIVTLGVESFSSSETELMQKFSINLQSKGSAVEFAETMFQLLESGRYKQRIHGINRLMKVTREPPRGLTDADLQDFFQIVKMEYFKRITRQPAPAMDARESAFYARQPTSSRAPQDVLLLASDLFDKLENQR